MELLCQEVLAFDENPVIRRSIAKTAACVMRGAPLESLRSLRWRHERQARPADACVECHDAILSLMDIDGGDDVCEARNNQAIEIVLLTFMPERLRFSSKCRTLQRSVKPRVNIAQPSTLQNASSMWRCCGTSDN